MEHSSYEISKRLHDKGFRAEHESWWADPNKDIGRLRVISDAQTSWMDFRQHYNMEVPAYTFTELWGAMPNDIHPSDEVMDYLKIMDEDCRVGYYCADSASWLGHVTFSHESPAECAAMMVEWLLDNGHINGGNDE